MFPRVRQSISIAAYTDLFVSEIAGVAMPRPARGSLAHENGA